MALTAILTIGDITRTDDGSTRALTDDTTYGGAELARAAVAVYLLAYKVDEDLEEAVLAIAEYDVTTDAEFTVTNSTDGHQKFALIIIPNYSGVTAYVENDVVYDSDTLYKALQASTGQDLSDPDYFEEIDITTVYATINHAEEPGNISYDIEQTVLTFSAQDCLTEIAALDAKDNCRGACKNPKIRQDMENLWLLVYGATVASNQGKYTEGEVMMRMAENYCNCD